MTEKQFAKWAKTRKMGRERFIWLHGVLIWGISTAILWSIFMMVSQGFNTLPLNLAIALILFPIGGYFWGILMWKLSEKKYNEATNNNVSN